MLGSLPLKSQSDQKELPIHGEVDQAGLMTVFVLRNEGLNLGGWFAYCLNVRQHLCDSHRQPMASTLQTLLFNILDTGMEQ